MRCFFGHKLTRVQEDRYQYCEVCGKAFIPPELDMIPCNHKWKYVKTVEVFETPESEKPLANIEVLQCEGCGNFRQFEIEKVVKKPDNNRWG